MNSPPAPPMVSVIVPTYNRAHLLPRALDSIRAQSFTDFEVIVVDDGSTDNTAATMRRYIEADARFKYVVQPRNAGVSAARNRGMAEARGKYFAFLDSDDEWFPDKLERQMSVFERGSDEVGLVWTGVETLGGDGSRSVDCPKIGGQVWGALLGRNLIHGGGSNAVVRHEVIERVGRFDEGIPASEDWDLWIRIAQHYHVAFVPEPLIRYHDPHGISRKSLDTQNNLDARDWLYRKHGREMRRAGVAHLFLIESAKRHLSASVRDIDAARRLAFQAACIRPWSPRVLPLASRLLLRRFLPERGYGLLRTMNRWRKTPRSPGRT